MTTRLRVLLLASSALTLAAGALAPMHAVAGQPTLQIAQAGPPAAEGGADERRQRPPRGENRGESPEQRGGARPRPPEGQQRPQTAPPAAAPAPRAEPPAAPAPRAEPPRPQTPAQSAPPREAPPPAAARPQQPPAPPPAQAQRPAATERLQPQENRPAGTERLQQRPDGRPMPPPAAQQQPPPRPTTDAPPATPPGARPQPQPPADARDRLQRQDNRPAGAERLQPQESRPAGTERLQRQDGRPVPPPAAAQQPPTRPTTEAPAATPPATPPGARPLPVPPANGAPPAAARPVPAPDQKGRVPSVPGAAPDQRGAGPGPDGQRSQFNQDRRPATPPIAAPLPPAPPPVAVTPLPASRDGIQDGPRRLEDFRSQRRETREGGRTIITEPGRVIVQDPNGQAFIRHNEVDRFRYGARDVRVERRGDENRTVIVRPDGSQIITIDDRDGRLLRRIRRDRDGREVIIIDNSYRGPRGAGHGFYVDIPPPVVRMPRNRYIVEYDEASPEIIYETMLAPPVQTLERRYTLDEIRYSPSVRQLMPRVDLDTVNFETGSWAVTPDQAAKLQVIADAINRAISRNPSEVFLIEGHTDAVGSDLDNLSLSDRRAESVAEILTAQFQVPPENLTSQGYGEQYLKIQTQAAERQNRRVTIRRITPLLNGNS